MNQTQTQNAEYWESQFSLADSDLEQIYNHFLETEKPQSADELAALVIGYRLREAANELRRLMADRTIYQPKLSYSVGAELVFPSMKLAQGTVTSIRSGFNPEYGEFNVITVEIKGKLREFVADFNAEHVLNNENGGDLADQWEEEVTVVRRAHGAAVAMKLNEFLAEREDFVHVGDKWFVRSLLADINIGHLHLTEAILEVADGGPLTTTDILTQLELDPSIDAEVKEFSLAEQLRLDGRFDDVSPNGQHAWFLRRMEPEGVRTIPERLEYQTIYYDRALLTAQQVQLEQELDDEWSEIPAQKSAESVVLALSYPHRWAGSLPINSKTRALFHPVPSRRQRIRFIDSQTNDEVVGWVVADGRYVLGLGDWYKANSIPVGGFIYLQPGPRPDVIMLDFDRRRPQREWVRLAVVKDNKLHFDLMRRAVPCGYDDLLIVGTDVVTAIDAHARKVVTAQMSMTALLTEVFPSLATLTPQNTVHAKTLYSAVNMLRRVPPGPIFAELNRNPAFKAVGDHYWQYGTGN